MADEYKFLFKEASAKEGTKVNEIFQELVEKIDAEAKPEVPNTEKKNQLYQAKDKKRNCC